MITKHKLLCLILVSFSINVHAQHVISIGKYGALSNIGASSSASGATGVAERGLSSAVLYNPACLNYQAFTITVEMNGRMPMNLSSRDFYYDGIVSLPSLVTVGYSKDNWTLAAGYFNYYRQSNNGHHKIVGFPYSHWVTTVNELSRDIVINSFTTSANYSSGPITYGITLGLNHLTDDESETSEPTRTGRGLGVLVSSGILLKVGDRLDFGTSIRYSSPIDFTLDTLYGKSDYSTRFPFIIESGFSSLISPRIRVLASVEYQNYSTVYDFNRFLFQVHTGSIIYLSKNLNVRGGFFTRLNMEMYSQCFLTFGIDVKTPSLDLTLSVLDTHAFPIPYDYHQTIISLGGTYMIE